MLSCIYGNRTENIDTILVPVEFVRKYWCGVSSLNRLYGTDGLTRRDHHDNEDFRDSINEPVLFESILKRTHKDKSQKGSKANDGGRSMGMSEHIVDQEDHFLQGRMRI